MFFIDNNFYCHYYYFLLKLDLWWLLSLLLSLLSKYFFINSSVFFLAKVESLSYKLFKTSFKIILFIKHFQHLLFKIKRMNYKWIIYWDMDVFVKSFQNKWTDHSFFIVRFLKIKKKLKSIFSLFLNYIPQLFYYSL